MSKKKFTSIQTELDRANERIVLSEQKLSENRQTIDENILALNTSKGNSDKLRNDLDLTRNTINSKDEELSSLRSQLGIVRISETDNSLRLAT